MLLLAPAMMKEIGVILAIDIDTNIPFASGLHLIHHPNNIKVSKKAKIKDKLHNNGTLMKLRNGLMIVAILNHVLIHCE